VLQGWVDDRLPTRRTHLDVAASGRLSRTAFDEQVAHLRAEADGAYAAEAEAAGRIDAGRAAVAAMVGLTAGDVAFSEGGGVSFATLLDGWPLGPGARIGTASSEYGGNALVLRDRADRRGWVLVPLEVDGLGRIASIPDGLDLVTFPHVASQRGIAQPVEQVLASGIPLLLDVAQSLGQSPVPPGAAAYVGTSRKWLCGPRGVGFSIVPGAWQDRLTPPPTLNAGAYDDVRRWDTPEAHVAGRVGFARAAQQWSPALLPVVHAAAAAARVLLTGAGGWRVVEPVEEPTGITTLLPPDGADVVATRAMLLAEGFVTSAVPATRAADMVGPVLRVSTAAWVTPDDLDRLAAALARRTA